MNINLTLVSAEGIQIPVLRQALSVSSNLTTPMENPDLKLSAKDYAIRVTKGALGAVPFVGGLLGELLDIAVYPQQQRKLNEWFEFVDTTLNQLVDQGAKTKEQIFSDEEFLSIFQKLHAFM